MKAYALKVYQWATEKAASERAPLWIGLLFFMELFFFIPIDAILAFFCLQAPRRTFLYVVIASVASTLSGVAGYLLGRFLWDLIGPYVVPSLVSVSLFERISGHFQTYETGAVMLGCFLPFPLKAISLAAGVFKIGVVPFASAMLVARLLRFALVGGAMLVWGDKLKIFLDRHYHRLMLLVGAKIAAAFLFFWILAQ
ncbi:MAG: VTT domain-containing protein [Verrucomicrobiota bacterium]|nr:VTT domain-containing protein [Verrucomicrobiota bacterium]